MEVNLWKLMEQFSPRKDLSQISKIQHCVVVEWVVSRAFSHETGVHVLWLAVFTYFIFLLSIIIFCIASLRQCLESEDDLQQLQSDGVPSEVTDWLASTFTQRVPRPVRRSDEKPKFRSIVHAVQAGIFVER